MDVNRLSQAYRIVAVASVLLLIDLWMSWYSVGATSASAWQVFSWTDILLFITTLVGIGAAVARGMGHELSARLTPVVAPLAGVMTLLVLYRIVNQPGPNKYVSVEWGAYLGLVLVALLAYGGWRAAGESSELATPVAPAAPAA